jgi:hypothetical protein
MCIHWTIVGLCWSKIQSCQEMLPPLSVNVEQHMLLGPRTACASIELLLVCADQKSRVTKKLESNFGEYLGRWHASFGSASLPHCAAVNIFLQSTF